MINIRSDEDSSPQDVLDEMTPEQAAKVLYNTQSLACMP